MKYNLFNQYFHLFYHKGETSDKSVTSVKDQNDGKSKENPNNNIDLKRFQMFKRATITLGILMVSYTISYWPIFGYVFCLITSMCTMDIVVYKYLLFVMVVVNSGLNPFIYAFRIKEFKTCLKRMLMCSCKK